MSTSPAASLHGPALAGIFVQSILYGISLMQTYHYFSAFPKDPLWMKTFVTVVMLASTVNSVLSFTWIYDVLIYNFMNVNALLALPWELAADPAMVGIIAGVVQVFFAWRIKILTKNWIIFSVIVAGALMTCVGGLVFAASFATFPSVLSLATEPSARTMAAIWLVPAAVDDVLITATLSFYLRRSRTGFAATDDIISKIIRLTVQNGLITSTIALIDLLTFLTMPHSGIHIAFSFPLPKLYANTLLSSLCSRDPRGISSSQASRNETNQMGLRSGLNWEHRRPEVFVSVEMQKNDEQSRTHEDREDWSETDVSTMKAPVV